MSLSYAILGTGALGGYYGGQLARAGRRVHYLLHSDYEHVRQHGLRVDLPDDSYTISPETHDVTFHGDADDMPAADVVLICLKTTQNHLLPDLLPKPGTDRWKPGTLVVTLQNGLHPERDAAAVVGDEHVAGGLCFLCSNKPGPGHIAYLDYGFIKLGSHAPKPSTNMLEKLPGVAADFRGAGVDCDVVDDLVLARWQKLVWNVPFNGLSVVLNLTTDKMMADPDVRRRVEALMHEVAAAARAVDGKTIDAAFIQNMLDYTAKMAPYKTSMMLDYEAGKRMEILSIVSDPLEAATKANCETPELEKLDQELWTTSTERKTKQATRRLKWLLFSLAAAWVMLGLFVGGYLRDAGHEEVAKLVGLGFLFTFWLPGLGYTLCLLLWIKTRPWRNLHYGVKWKRIERVVAMADEDDAEGFVSLGVYLSLTEKPVFFHSDTKVFAAFLSTLERKYPDLERDWLSRVKQKSRPFEEVVVAGPPRV